MSPATEAAWSRLTSTVKRRAGPQYRVRRRDLVQRPKAWLYAAIGNPGVIDAVDTDSCPVNVPPRFTGNSESGSRLPVAGKHSRCQHSPDRPSRLSKTRRQTFSSAVR
jgi:hypothetical protein